MNDFVKFKKTTQLQFKSMLNGDSKLFVTDIEKDALWSTYLDSFPNVLDNTRNRLDQSDLMPLNQFIRCYGNVVAIENNELVSVWDIKRLNSAFDETIVKLSELVKSVKIKSVFCGLNEADLSEHRIFFSENVFNEEEIRKNITEPVNSFSANGNKLFFKEAMDELTIESGELALEMIECGIIYDGEKYLGELKSFLKYKNKYTAIPDNEKDNWCWINSFHIKQPRIIKGAIGSLLKDISAGVDLEVAVARFDDIVCPTIITEQKRLLREKTLKALKIKGE